jgi:hypothetical protein
MQDSVGALFPSPSKHGLYRGTYYTSSGREIKVKTFKLLKVHLNLLFIIFQPSHIINCKMSFVPVLDSTG